MPTASAKRRARVSSSSTSAPSTEEPATGADGFTGVMGQADFAGLAGGGDAERAGVRVLLRDASKDGFEHLRVEVVFGDRAPRLGVALQRIQPRLHRFD